MRENAESGSAELRGIDQASVTQLVQNDEITPPAERWDGAHGRGVAGRKSQGGFGFLKSSQGALQSRVGWQGPTHQPRGPSPGPIEVEALFIGVPDRAGVGEAEVIVG